MMIMMMMLEVASKNVQSESWNYGWDHELMNAYRQPQCDRQGSSELAMPIEKDVVEKPDEDLYVATFKDGSTTTISGITNKFVKTLIAKRSAPNAEPIWSGEHIITHNRLKIQPKVCRSLLILLVEQNRQILQIQPCKLGPLPSPQPASVDPEHPTMQIGIKWLKGIAEKYAADKIKAEDLYKARDEFYKEKAVAMPKIAKPKKEVKKRPAAKKDAAKQPKLKRLKKISDADLAAAEIADDAASHVACTAPAANQVDADTVSYEASEVDAEESSERDAEVTMASQPEASVSDGEKGREASVSDDEGAVEDHAIDGESLEELPEKSEKVPEPREVSVIPPSMLDVYQV